MQTTRLFALTAAVLLLAVCHHHADADPVSACVSVTTARKIDLAAADIAVTTAVEFRDGNVVLARATKTDGGFVLDDAAYAAVSEIPLRSPEMRRKVHLALLDSSEALRGELRPFTVGSEDCARVYGSGEAAPAAPTRVGPGSDESPRVDELQAVARLCDLQGKDGLEIVFGPDGGVCRRNREFSVEGDLISVRVVGFQETTPAENVGMTIEGCGRAPSLAPILVSGSFPTNLPKSGGTLSRTPYTKEFVSERCFGTAPTIVLRNFPVPDAATRFPLVQYERYRGTLQLGVSYSDRHDETFEVRTTGTERRIFSKGPIGRGPEYLATVVVYGLPNYLSRGRHYYGRDVIHDDGFNDRLGVVVAVGLSKPGDRFAVGLSFELVYGLNVLGLYERTRIDTLDGTTNGALYTGDADALPITRAWGGKVVLGLGLDLRYVTALFDRK